VVVLATATINNEDCYCGSNGVELIMTLITKCRGWWLFFWLWCGVGGLWQNDDKMVVILVKRWYLYWHWWWWLILEWWWWWFWSGAGGGVIIVVIMMMMVMLVVIEIVKLWCYSYCELVVWMKIFFSLKK